MAKIVPDRLKGYAEALDDVAELIRNATVNGERQHWDTELHDQLNILREQQGLDVTEKDTLI